jgi:hypothetical protein
MAARSTGSLVVGWVTSGLKVYRPSYRSQSERGRRHGAGEEGHPDHPVPLQRLPRPDLILLAVFGLVHGFILKEKPSGTSQRVGLH